jgi:hypothetical protein
MGPRPQPSATGARGATAHTGQRLWGPPVRRKGAARVNVYAREPAAFDADSRALASRLASYTALVAGNMLLYEDAVAKAAKLELALRSRAVIDQAKGMLMERFRLTADQAFHALAQVSMESNRKVRDVAERCGECGELRASSVS